MLAFERALATSTAGRLPTPPVVVPFRLLSSVADVTAGYAEQISRIVAASVTRTLGCRPRAAAVPSDDLDAEFVPADDRTTVRARPTSPGLPR